MTFHPEHIDQFLDVFTAVKDQIRNFNGCQKLDLLQDQNRPHVVMTYSIWDSPDHLEAYRHSDLFKATWSQTKTLFAERPEAWSMNALFEL